MKILPQPNNNYFGSKFSLIYLIILACMFTFRGFVHYFAPDGGIGIIAGVPIDNYSEGAVKTIILKSGEVGMYHLFEAILAWLIIFRWRTLIPLFLFYVLISQCLGIALITVKPLPVVPPGQIGAYILTPLTFLAFYLSIRKSKKDEGV